LCSSVRPLRGEYSGLGATSQYNTQHDEFKRKEKNHDSLCIN